VKGCRKSSTILTFSPPTHSGVSSSFGSADSGADSRTSSGITSGCLFPIVSICCLSASCSTASVVQSGCSAPILASRSRKARSSASYSSSVSSSTCFSKLSTFSDTLLAGKNRNMSQCILSFIPGLRLLSPGVRSCSRSIVRSCLV
jgi:hypothetical protein